MSHTKGRIHFIGICGVAMSALAIAFQKAGWDVTGSDVGFFPPVSTNLASHGIAFYPGWHPELMLKNGRPDLIVVGNVAGSSNPEWVTVQEQKLPYASYPEVVARYMVKKNSIVCAGTYGKTTSTTLLTWILLQAGFTPSYLFGGIAQNALDAASLQGDEWSILEGDEYKTSRSDLGPKFAHYSPTHLLLTSVVWDHADVYPTERQYIKTFQTLLDAIPQNGLRVLSEKAISVLDTKDYSVVSYGRNNQNRYVFSDVQQSIYGIRFHLHDGGHTFPIVTTMLGEFTADNITGCFALAREIGIDADIIIRAIADFRGIRRRLEKRLEGPVTIFDDIAHSPSKAKAILESLRAVCAGRLTAIFEPNTGNRQPEAVPGYAHAFRAADRVIIPRLTKIKIDVQDPQVPMNGEQLAGVIRDTHPNVTYEPDDDALVMALKKNATSDDIIVFLGSHGFRGMIDALVQHLSS